MLGLYKAYKFTDSELLWKIISEMKCNNVKRRAKKEFTSRFQQQVTDMIILAQGYQQRSILKTIPTFKILFEICGQEWANNLFFRWFFFYLASNYSIYSVSCGISFITCLLVMFISFNFSMQFLYSSKYCTGNFRIIEFLSKLHLGILPWTLRTNFSIL